jgi:hypothetical protein
MDRRSVRTGTSALITAALVVTLASAVLQAQHKGLLLADALRTLQASGLRIVFSTATVRPDMRVENEPRSQTPRQQLDELLAPHGLEVRAGPRGILEIVRARPSRAQPAGVQQRMAAIEGVVVDAVSGIPLPDVHMQVEGTSLETRTDANGRFGLRRVEPGERVLIATTGAHARAALNVHAVSGRTAVITVSLAPASVTHREYVAVIRDAPRRTDAGVASENGLEPGDLERLSGSLVDDPARAVHALPRVTAVDDFRNEFAVRGSPLRHVEIVVDGVSTAWLQHTAHRRGATGSLSMFPSSVLEDATLRAGAYPHRYGNRIGPQLDFRIREGSRTGFSLRGAVGGANMTLLGEGPIGGSARGSWLAAFRQSYLEWPTERPESTRTPFGFVDGLAKVAYDVSDSQQVTAMVMTGMSNVDADDHLPSNQLGGGRSQALVASLSWRSTLGSAALTQQAYVVTRYFANTDAAGQERDRGASQSAVYRAGVSRPISQGLLEAGAQIGRAAVDGVPRGNAERAAASSSLGSGYVHVTWPVSPSLTISPGVRVDASAIVRERATTRWLLAEWTFRPGWALDGSIGAAGQLPELDHVLAASKALEPERGSHADIGIEQRITRNSRWQVTAFSRRERDILREPDGHPRLAGAAIVAPEPSFLNALDGTSRGIELLVERRSSSGLAGWIAYSFAKTRYTDAVRAETFWGDFDQRHAVTGLGSYRFSHGTTVGATFRAGSNFPIPAYLVERAEGLYLGPHRNQVRLPAYSRLDLRADHALDYFGRRLSFFVEMLNVLNRANAGLAGGSIDTATGQATGFTDTLFRRRVAAGILVEF